MREPGTQFWSYCGRSPWKATGLEWQTPSPPPTENFEVTPVVTQPPYTYGRQEAEVVG